MKAIAFPPLRLDESDRICAPGITPSVFIFAFPSPLDIYKYVLCERLVAEVSVRSCVCSIVSWSVCWSHVQERGLPFGIQHGCRDKTHAESRKLWLVSYDQG